MFNVTTTNHLEIRMKNVFMQTLGFVSLTVSTLVSGQYANAAPIEYSCDVKFREVQVMKTVTFDIANGRLPTLEECTAGNIGGNATTSTFNYFAPSAAVQGCVQVLRISENRAKAVYRARLDHPRKNFRFSASCPVGVAACYVTENVTMPTFERMSNSAGRSKLEFSAFLDGRGTSQKLKATVGIREGAFYDLAGASVGVVNGADFSSSYFFPDVAGEVPTSEIEVDCKKLP